MPPNTDNKNEGLEKRTSDIEVMRVEPLGIRGRIMGMQ
jgi:hypothetical protein